MITLIKLVELFYTVFSIMLFIKILSSWIPEFQRSKILQFISFYTDPYLNIFRRIIPPIGMLDISPIIAILCLGLIKFVIIYILTAIYYLF